MSVALNAVHSLDLLENIPNFSFIKGQLTAIYPKSRYVHILECNDITSKNDSKYMKVLYEKLLLCTGAKPRMLGPLNERCIALRDDSSVEKFLELLKNSKNVCIAGNGGISLELIHHLKGYNITWIIRDSYIGTAFFDEPTSLFFYYSLIKQLDENKEVTSNYKSSKENIMKYFNNKIGYSVGPGWTQNDNFQKLMKNDIKKNVNMIFNTEIVDIIMEKNTVIAGLSNGNKVAFDFIVLALGAVANSEFEVFEDLELNKDDISNGIVVNSLMQTSINDIYAAGDCCTLNLDDYFSENAERKKDNFWFQMKLWNQARNMGTYAAKVIYSELTSTLDVEEYHPLPIQFEIFTHATSFFGKYVVLLGKYNVFKNDNREVLIRVDENDDHYIRCILQNNKMVGAICIGDTDLCASYAETFENIILNQLDLTDFKEHLLDPEFELSDFFD